MKIVIIIALLLAITFADGVNCKRLNFFPMPKQIKCGSDSQPLDDPCKLLFHVKIAE